MEGSEKSKKPKRKRENIPAHALVGDNELFLAFGIGEKIALKMRESGLPFYSTGGVFMYFPEEVKDWIKKHWRVRIPEIKV